MERTPPQPASEYEGGKWRNSHSRSSHSHFPPTCLFCMLRSSLPRPSLASPRLFCIILPPFLTWRDSRLMLNHHSSSYRAGQGVASERHFFFPPFPHLGKYNLIYFGICRSIPSPRALLFGSRSVSSLTPPRIPASRGGGG